MSAITGIGDSLTIVFSASTSSSRGTAQRTMSAPASATLRICSIVAARLAVSVLVIVCTATGAPPPIGTPPTNICRLEAMGQGYLQAAHGLAELGLLLEDDRPVGRRGGTAARLDDDRHLDREPVSAGPAQPPSTRRGQLHRH